MTFKNPYGAYRKTQTVTASQTQLIVMLHDGAIRFLSQSAAAIAELNFEKKSINLNKALAIVDHLWGTLDQENGGDLALNLDLIFRYLHERLIWANAKDDTAILKEVMVHLRGLRESWAELESQEQALRPISNETGAFGDLMAAA